MTLWNLTTMFSRQAVPRPRAGYDPSRTGDPVGPRPAEPAIGIGDAFVGGASVTAPRRHPIGFAPPQETEVQTSYRTEISFKRHHELPRASAVADGEPEATLPSWQTPPAIPDTPETAVGDAPAGSEWHDPLPTQALETDDIVADAAELGTPEQPAMEDETPAEEQIPFYKREISFRRRKPEEAAVHDEHGVVASADADEAAQHVDDSAAEVASGAEVEQAPETEEQADAGDAVDTPEAGDQVPFYKREISFRRKAAIAAAVAVPEPEPEAEAALPADNAHQGTEDADDGVDEVAEVATEVAAEADVGSDVPETEHPQALGATVVALPATPADAPVDEPEAVAAATDTEPGDTDSADEPDAASVPVANGAETNFDAKRKRFGGGRERKDKDARKRNRGHHPHKGKVVGLKIGASQIAAAVVSEGADGNEVHALARTTLEAGIVVDGEVRDEGALSSALKAFFEAEELPRTDVRIGLSSNRIGVRTIEIPAVEDEVRFDNAVRFKAHEVLPVALSESVLDYRVLSERTTAEGEVLRKVLLVVAPRDQVEPYQRVADAAGIRLAGADLEALALLRAFVAPRSGAAAGEDDTATVVVAVGHESSTLLVEGGGICEFTRVFDWGGSALIDAVATALDVRPVEAAAILRHLSLTGPGRQYESLDEERRMRATDAVRQRLTPFARELVNSLQFYQTQDGSLGIGKILITGGTSHLEGIDAALSQMIGVEVAVGDPFSRTAPPADLDRVIEASIGSLAVPIGLAIRDDASRAVDLLPRQSAKRRRDTRPAPLAIAVPVAVAVPLAAMAALYLGAHGKASDQQAQLDAVRAEIAALPKPTGPVIDAAVVGDEATRATAVASLLGGRVEWDGVLRSFARILPANVWLTSLSFAQPDALTAAAAAPPPAPGAAAAAPSAVSVDGYTYTQADVALLLARLATLPSLQRVTLAKSERTTLNDKQVVHFTIVADLAQTGGAS